MLYEIALTPDSLRPHQEGDSIEHLRALGRMLLREVHGRDGALCVGNLCEGRWLNAIRSMFRERANPKTAPILEDLAKCLEQYSLERPHSRPNVKHKFSQEHEWAKEAVLCHKTQRPFDRIAIGTAQQREEHRTVEVVTDLASVVDDRYSQSLVNYRRPAHQLNSQSQALSPLLARADWIAFVLPNIRGDGGEMPLLRRLLEDFARMHARPGAYRALVVTSAKQNATKETDRDYDKYVLETRTRLHSELDRIFADRRSIRLDIIINDNVLNRYIIAGTMSRGSPRARWAVDLSHPYRTGRPRDFPKFRLEPAECVADYANTYLPKDFLDL